MATLKKIADSRVKAPMPEPFVEQKLLSAAEETLSKDLEVFKQLKLKNNEISDVYRHRENSLRFNRTREVYGESSYHEDDLERIAVAYNLRLLKTEYYKGKVPHNIISEIRHFCNKHDIDIEGPASERFYILGPEEQFVLKKFERPPKTDPMMLYKTEDDYYIPVVQWGGEINVFRYLRSWRKRSFLHRFSGNWILYACLVFGVFTVFGWTNTFTGSSIAGSVIGFFVAGIDFLIAKHNENSNWDGTEKFWRDTTGRRWH